MRNIIVLVFISTLLTGCSPKLRYLTPQAAMKYPVVMIANCDIDCGKYKIIKGTIFIVKELGGSKYQTYSNDVYRNTVLMLQKKNKLPDDALYIKLQEKYKWGYVVYPNGQFVYDNYFIFGFNSFRKLITTTGQKCTYSENPPFILKRQQMKQLTILLSSLFLALLFNACASKPILKQYVPNEKVKTVYVTKDIPQVTKESISNQHLENDVRDNINRASSLKISSLFYEPYPLLANKAFDFVCKLKADIPEMGNRTIPVIFYFKVYIDSKIVFTSEKYIVDAKNNTNKEWTQHMNPFSKIGIYKFEAFIKYNNLFDRKTIDVKIE